MDGFFWFVSIKKKKKSSLFLPLGLWVFFFPACVQRHFRETEQTVWFFNQECMRNQWSVSSRMLFLKTHSLASGVVSGRSVAVAKVIATATTTKLVLPWCSSLPCKHRSSALSRYRYGRYRPESACGLMYAPRPAGPLQQALSEPLKIQLLLRA